MDWQFFMHELRQSLYHIFSPVSSDWPDWLWAVANIELILQAALVFALLLLGRYIYDLVTPFSLSEVLTARDNKALSISFACYLGGLAIIIAGVYSSPSSRQLSPESALPEWRLLLYRLSDTFFWGAVAICLLLLAQILNNKLILSRFDNYKQIIERGNLAVGLAEGSSYIASSLMIFAVMQGASPSFLLDMLLTLFYFALGQLSLILYSRVFILTRRKRWDLHRELAQQNPAAACSFAFNLCSFALLQSSYIANFFSFYGFILAALLNTLLLLLLDFLIDTLFFPKVSLHEELARDHNWGSTLIEGFLLLGLGSVYVIAFSSYLA